MDSPGRLFLFAAVLLGTLTAASGPSLAQSDQPYAMGAIPDPPAALSAAPQAPVFRDWYPKSYDLSKYLPPPGDQGHQGSCVGWAIAYAARSAQFAYDNEVSPAKASNIASPAALYDQIRTGAGCMKGSYPLDALRLLQSTGVPSLSQAPYDQRNCSTSLSGYSSQQLDRFRIKSYGVVNTSSELGRIQAKIFRQHPVMASMAVPSSFFHYRGGIFRDTTSKIAGYHAITIVGYDDNRRAYKVINSWGRRWGDHGYFWLSYDAADKLLRGAYTMDTEPQQQRPKPPPPPVPIVHDQPQPNVKGPEGQALAIAQRFKCAGVSSFQEKKKAISAFAKTEVDRSVLQDMLEKAFSGYDVKVGVAPWPQCEALITFAKPLKTPDGLSVAIDGVAPGTADPVLKDGDPFVLHIRTPDYPSYLYATYLESDNQGKHEAVNLIQSVSPLQQYQPGTEIVLGDGHDDGPVFTIQGPNFGREMLILIASASPLYDTERPLREIERDYLSALRDRLTIHIKDKGERRLSATVLALTTKPKGTGQ